MESRPEKCPICGSKITRVVNAETRNSYFKCSNKACHFVVGSRFTEEEFYLQGTTLQSTCVKCGQHLTVANGPRGLYARCFSCNCDLEPTMYNGKMYQRWANARKERAKEEIENLIKNFNVKNADDELYDFENYIAANPATEAKPTKKGRPKSSTKVEVDESTTDKIIKLFKKNLNKDYTAEEISDETGLKVNTVRTILLSLRTLKQVKITDYIDNPTGGCALLYQFKESKIPQVKIYTEKDGYSPIPSFLRQNVDKYGSIVRAKDVLKGALGEMQVEPVPCQTSRGVSLGYSCSLMHEILNRMIAGSYTEKAPTKRKVVTKKMSNSAVRKEYVNKILTTLKGNLNRAWTRKELEAHLGVSKNVLHRSIKNLLEKKTIKIVGWDQDGSFNHILPKFQVTSSPLPKLRVYNSESTSTYSTLYNYYNKKLRGKRLISTKELYEKMKSAETVLISSLNGYYTGYAVSDISNAVKELQGITPSVKKKKVSTSIDIETEAILSKAVANENITKPRKSIFSTITSFFNKKKDKDKEIIPEHSVSSN